MAKPNLIVGIGGAGNRLVDALWHHHPKIGKIADEIVIDTRTPENEKLLKKRLKGGVKYIFLFAGLGGEVGGTLTVDLARISRDENVSTYVVGVIPASRRADRDSLDRSYQTLVELKNLVKGIIIVDNDKISHLPYFENYHDRYNEYVASILSDILEAGSNDEVLGSLSFEDEAGYAAVARSSELTKGVLGYILPIIPHRDIDIRTMLRVALEKLTLFDNPNGSAKGVLIISVPEERINTIDQRLVEDLMQAYTENSTIDIRKSNSNVASITTIFTYRFEEFKALKRIERRI